MQRKLQISPGRQFLYGLMVLGVFLSGFSTAKSSEISENVELIPAMDFIIKTGEYDVPIELMEALKSKLIEIEDESGNATTYGIIYFEEHPHWAWINITVADGEYYNVDEVGPMFLFFAALLENTWAIALSSNDAEYVALLDQISREQLTIDKINLLDDYYFINKSGSDSDLNALAGNLLYPWPNSQNPWLFSGYGFHPTGYSFYGVEAGSEAMDLIPPSSIPTAKVLSMEGGIIVNKFACTWNTILILKHNGYSNPKRFVYVHIQNGTSPVGIGQTVSQGQHLGDLRNPVFNEKCDGKNFLNCEIDKFPSSNSLCSKSYGRHLHLGFGADRKIVIDGKAVGSIPLGDKKLISTNRVASANISPTMATFNKHFLITYRDTNGKIQTEVSTSGAAWKRLEYTGGSTDGKISMVAFKDRIYQAVRGQDNKIYTRWSSDGLQWNKWLWINNSGSTKENISMIVFNNRLYQAVVGENNKVYYRSTGNGDSWNTWTSKDASSFFANGDVSMEVFKGSLYQAVRGQDNKIYTRSTSDGLNWSSWIQINQSGSTLNNITMTIYKQKLYQSVSGMDNKIYTRSTSDGNAWSKWASDSSQETLSEVSMIAYGNRLYQAIRGEDNKIFTRHSSNGTNWSNWQVQSGKTRNLIGMHTFGQDLFQVVYGENDRVYLRSSNRENPADWTRWVISTHLKSTILRSNHTHDGWILESGEFKDIGSARNATADTLRVGDDSEDRQYRAILSFNTSSIPANAVITKVTLKIKRSGVLGDDPFTTHGKLLVDIRKGAFSNNDSLQSGDWQAEANKSDVGSIPKTLSSGWYTKVWTGSIFDYINTGGITQLRLQFATQDNDDENADYLKLYSGNAPAASRPQLIVEYYVP